MIFFSFPRSLPCTSAPMVCLREGSNLVPAQLDAANLLATKQTALLHGACGSGKSITALYALFSIAEFIDDPHFLIVTPKAVVPAFKGQLLTHFTQCSTFTVAKGASFNGALITFCSYSQLQNLPDVPWDAVVFDESHFLRNTNTLRFRLAKLAALHADVLWGLSGTPIVNVRKDFHCLHSLHDTVGEPADLVISLPQQVQKLPTISYDKHFFPFDFPLPDDDLHHLAKLTYFRRHSEAIQAKLDFVLALKGKVLVFANFNLAFNMLLRSRSDALVFTRNPLLAMHMFNSGSCNLLLCNFKAAGVGISLTAAQHIVFLAPPLTAADVLQAVSRAHRPGLLHNIQVHSLISRDPSWDSHFINLVNFKHSLGILHDYDQPLL